MLELCFGNRTLQPNRTMFICFELAARYCKRRFQEKSKFTQNVTVVIGCVPILFFTFA